MDCGRAGLTDTWAKDCSQYCSPDVCSPPLHSHARSGTQAILVHTVVVGLAVVATLHLVGGV